MSPIIGDVITSLPMYFMLVYYYVYGWRAISNLYFVELDIQAIAL
jgi:hypothetical protein